MNYIIISTYPKSGSQNIGDALITRKTIEVLKTVVKSNIKNISVVWRADDWNAVVEKFQEADVVIFACLAIRPNMEDIEYPYIREVMKLDKKIYIISAGTSLLVDKSVSKQVDEFPKETLKILKKLNDISVVCTTRGFLTQCFCEKAGLEKFTYSGDVAFFNQVLSEQKINNKQIKTISISDPHKGAKYLGNVELLYQNLKCIFPNADIIQFLHGKNPPIEKWCIANNIQIKKLYLDPENGLAEYDQIDMHVGFRVHGHVTALSKLKISYLLEQDGRGKDYGLSIPIKCSIPNPILVRYKLCLKNLIKSIFYKRNLFKSTYVSKSPIEEIIAMISCDSENNFHKFNSLKEFIELYNQNLINTVGMKFDK